MIENQEPRTRNPPKAVVLLSGGMDSAVCAAQARADGFQVHALTVRYGQRHAVEIEAARRVARALDLASHAVVDVDLRAIGGSALTADIPVPETRPDEGLPLDAAPLTAHSSKLKAPPIPSTYVPARNTILLGLALGHAEVLGANDVYIGVSSVDYSGYPDCRPAFIDAFERLAQVATKAGVEGAQFRIHAPLQYLTKAETIRRGLELGVDFALTHTCYDPAPDGAACGACDSCRLRREGFAAAGVPDPTRYAPVAGARNEERRTKNEERSIRLRRGSTARSGRDHVRGRAVRPRPPGRLPLRCSYCDTDYARDARGWSCRLGRSCARSATSGPASSC